MKRKPGLSYRFQQLVWSGLDLLFPPACAGCNKPGYRWCPDCQRKLEPVPDPICEICGEPLPKPGLCSRCETTRPAYQALRSCVVFNGPIRNALHQMKYKRNYGLGGDLSPLLAENLERLGWEIDIIIPIPLSRQRLQERGYNQVGLIAQPLSKYLRWEYLPGALGRSRHTRSQVGLSAVERRENVQGAFQASSARLQGKTVLLMDDVATTGSTLSAASQALLSSGAQKIYALTLAKAIHKYGLDSVPASVPVRSLS